MQALAQHVVFPAGPTDSKALGDVHVRAWRETYPGILPATYLAALRPEAHAARFAKQLNRDGKGDVLLAAEGVSGLVGYCGGGHLPWGDPLAESEVYTLYLLKAAQGRGLGARLLGGAAGVLQAQGAVSLAVWVLSRNTKARAFYEHLDGRAAQERGVAGWGGELLETAYVWDNIERLVAER